MAGMDASANLGGMLSQIGGTLGGMGQAGQGLMQPIMTSFRPQLDPNSVESLQRQAAFQGRIGDTEQARLFTGQALALEERNREEAEKQRKLEEGQARTKALNDYTQALAAKDPVAMKAAEAEAMRVGQLQGFNMMPLLAQAEQRLRATQDAEFTVGERQRIATERAQNQAVDKATEALAAAFNSANTIEEMDVLLEQAGPLVAEQAQQLRDRGVARLDKDQQRRLAEAERGAQLGTIDAGLIPTGDGLPPALAEGLKKGVEAFNAEIEAFNKEVAGKKIVPNAKRQELERKRNALERRIYGLSDQVALTDYRTERDLKQSVDSKVRSILASNIPKTKVQENQQDPLGFFNKESYADAENRLKREAIREVYIQAGLPIPPEYEEAEEKDDKPGGQAGRRAARSGVPTSTAAPTGSGTQDDPINL
jgi:hypothetical protein